MKIQEVWPFWADSPGLAVTFLIRASRGQLSRCIVDVLSASTLVRDPRLNASASAASNARVVARLDIPDGSGLPMGSLGDHRVHDMIAAMSFLRYIKGTVTQYTYTKLLLESFLNPERSLSPL
jgi:hypothetical protein